MFSLIKGALSFLAFLVLVYALFFVPVGGQSVASHFYDIWRAPVVQNKIGSIKDDVQGRLETKLESIDREQAIELGREWTQRGEVEISDSDREKLEALLKAEAN